MISHFFRGGYITFGAIVKGIKGEKFWGKKNLGGEQKGASQLRNYVFFPRAIPLMGKFHPFMNSSIR